LIQDTFPDIRLLLLNQNLGFPTACNRGIQATSGDLVAILNNDVVLDRTWLEALLRQVSSPWSFWASRIVFKAEPQRVDSAGDGMAVIGTAYKIGHGELAELHSAEQEVFGPCAAAALYRRSMLQDLGGFDDDFFLVYEDADLNMRARLQGYRCLYIPEAIVQHQVNTSIRTFSHNYVYYGHRNSEYLFWKNMPASLLILYLPERILFNLLAFIYFAAKGRGSSFIKAKADFLLQFSEIRRKRRRIQKRRRVNRKQLRAMLDRNWLRYRRKTVIQT
jgi:GT2 family glycosyltransferase